jgi:hypothetical protein
MDGSHAPTIADAYDAMIAYRQRFLAAWLAWVKTKPPSEIIVDEIVATTSAMRQLGYGNLPLRS